MSRLSKQPSALISLLATMLLVTILACAPEQEADTQSTDSTMTETTGTATDLEFSGQEPFMATVNDIGITMPETIPAGPQMITVENQGTGNHGFAISGNGTEVSIDRELQPAEVATLNVDLQPGEYRAYCTVDPTMETTFTVVPAEGDASMAGTDTSSTTTAGTSSY